MLPSLVLLPQEWSQSRRPREMEGAEEIRERHVFHLQPAHTSTHRSPLSASLVLRAGRTKAWNSLGWRKVAAGEPPAFTLSCFCPAGRGSGSFSASLLGSKVDLNAVFILTTPGDFLLAAHISTVAPAASQRAASCLVGLQLGTKRESDLRGISLWASAF